jgi:hypothetical protein
VQFETFTNGRRGQHNAAFNTTAIDLLVSCPRFGDARRRPGGQDPSTDQPIRRFSCGNDPLTGYGRNLTDTKSTEA